MSERIVINFKHPIPVFPLPGCVLLPYSVQPLHIFEARYRQMVQDVIDGAGLIALGRFTDVNITQTEYLEGRPPLHNELCIGFIERYEPIEDGRYLIVLRGVCRASLIEEVDHEPYRTALLQPVEWPPAENDVLTEQRAAIESLVRDPAFDDVESFQSLRELCDEVEPTTGLIDLLIAATTSEVDDLQAMLGETDARARGHWLEAHLVDLRDSVRTGDGPPF